MRGAAGWARAEWRRRWPGLIAAAVLIGLFQAVGVAAIAGARRTDTVLERFRDAAHGRTLSFDVSVLPEGGLERLTAHPTVEELGLATGFISIGAGDYDLGIFADPTGRFARTVDIPRVIAGRMPRAHRPDEIALNVQAADDIGVGPGGRVTIETFTPQQFEQVMSGEGGDVGSPQGPKIDLRVTGIVRTFYDVASGETASAAIGTPAFHEKYDDEVAAFGHFGSVRLKRGEKDVEAFTAALERELPEGETAEIIPSDQELNDGREATSALARGLFAFGAIALLAAAVASAQAVRRVLDGAAADQPTLGALGLRRVERVAGLALVALPLVLGAAATSVAGAVALSPLFPISLARRAEPHRGVDFDGMAIGSAALAWVVFLAVAALSAGVGVVHGRRREERLRPSAAAALAANAGLPPSGVTGLRLALEPGRGATAVPVRPALLGALAGIAGVVAVATFASSLDRLVDTPARWGWNWDARLDTDDESARQVAEIDGVESVGIVMQTRAEVAGRELAAFSLDVLEGELSPTMLRGRPPVSPGEMSLDPRLLDTLGVDVGDRLTVTTVDDEELRLRVVGVNIPPFQTESYSESIVLTRATHDRVAFGDSEPETVVTFSPGVSTKEGLDRVAARFPFAVSIYSYPVVPAAVNNLDRLKSLPPALAAFLGLLAMAATGHALITAVRRRRRDLAVLRALGFARRQVLSAVAWQSTALAVIGLVAGIPLGLIVGRWTWSAVASGIGVAGDALVPAGLVALLAPATLAVANLAAAVPARRAARVAAAEVLRTE